MQPALDFPAVLVYTYACWQMCGENRYADCSQNKNTKIQDGKANGIIKTVERHRLFRDSQ